MKVFVRVGVSESDVGGGVGLAEDPEGHNEVVATAAVVRAGGVERRSLADPFPTAVRLTVVIGDLPAVWDDLKKNKTKTFNG